MSKWNVVALGNATVFCGGRKAKPDNVALHRVESVCFGVNADFGRFVEFLFHLFESFFVINADVGGREVGRKTCFYDFAGFARIAGRVVGRVARFAAIVFAHKTGFARNVFEQANQAVDFVFPENVLESIAVDAAEFKGVEVAVVGTLCL